MSVHTQDASVLVCLDLQRGRLGADGAGRTIAACREVLREARARRWPVLHVHCRDLDPPACRPISELEPLPSEAIFLRQGPSAFTNRRFSETAQRLGGPLVLVGFSLTDTVLATAFAAADRGLLVDVVAEAAGAPAAAREALLEPLIALGHRARLVSLRDLFFEDASRFAAANVP